MVKNQAKKRISIVSIRMIKESSFLYHTRNIISPEDGYQLVKEQFQDLDRESFFVCCLNTKNELMNISVVSIGSLNRAIIHPREVFKTAILSNSASILCFHNHPSGNPLESKEDIAVTRRLEEAGELLGIKVLDHIIIGDNKFTSLKEKGYL